MMSTIKSSNLLYQLFNRQYNNNSLLFQKHLYSERLRVAKNLYKYDLISHYGCVNAIEFSNEGEFLISGGDDKRVLLWNLEKSIAGKGQPRPMEKEHQSNIFCLSFNMDNSKIFSGGNDDVVIVHDVKTGAIIDVYLHVKPVYGLSVDPTNNHLIATAGEDGRILVFDQRTGVICLSLGKYRGPFHAVQFHPLDGRFLVSANSKKGSSLWDIRKPHNHLLQYGGDSNQQSSMSIRFNRNGNQVLVLRRRLPPILYNTTSPKAVCQFYHPDYYNSCTMKTCCFAGENDEYVLSGSDDFNLYVWRIADVPPDLSDQWIENTQMVLYGHRSIVNHVRYNYQKCLLGSSGVEKIVKLWSPFNQHKWNGCLMEEATGPENPREVFSHEAYHSLFHMHLSTLAHDYSQQNTAEDPRMMAFFDSLIQQEIEGWNTTNNSTDSDQFSIGSSENSPRQSSTESSDDGLLSCITRDRLRRRITRTAIEPQRNTYANRIAYLIATKRNTLRRLALKGASQRKCRRKNLIKNNKRKSQNQRNSIRINRNGIKRVTRFNSLNNRTRKREENILTKNARYKIMNNSSYLRSFRRKNKTRVLDCSDSSTDDNISNRSCPPTQRGLEILTSTNEVNSAIPSTSTGITANGNGIHFRLQQQYESDDDDNSSYHTENEKIIPKNIKFETPGKNLEKISNTIQFSSDIDEDCGKIITNNRKRHISKYNLDTYSSHSNSRLSNSSYLEEDKNSSSNESLDCNNKRRKIVPKNNNNKLNQFEMNEYETSNNNGRINNIITSTPDSGIVNTTENEFSSTSKSINDPNSNKKDINEIVSQEITHNGDKFSIKLFHQKVARVRRNYRKRFADESESD